MPVRLVVTLVGLSLLLTLLAGCAGGSAQRQPEPEATAAPPSPRPAEPGELREQDYVDVYSYGDSDWRPVWTANVPEEARFDLTAGRESGSNAARVEDDAPEMTQGFRVQLGDVLNQGQANLIRDRGLAIFDHVYITFRSPNYKIRAGNFLRRLDAEPGLQRARSAGFRDAWIVPDWVYVNPPAVDSLATDSLATESTSEAP